MAFSPKLLQQGAGGGLQMLRQLIAQGHELSRPNRSGDALPAQLHPQGGGPGLDAVTARHPPAGRGFRQGQIGHGFERFGCH